MRTINIRDHNFKKLNLVTTPKGDKLKCSVCGVEAWRRSFSEDLTVTEEQYKKAMKCTYVSDQAKPYEEVITGDIPSMGIKQGIHKIIPCPEEHKEKYNNSMWIYSDQRKEPVRLLPNEYEFVKAKTKHFTRTR